MGSSPTPGTFLTNLLLEAIGSTLAISLFDVQFGLNIGPWENDKLVPCLTKLTRLGYNGVEVTINTYDNYGDRLTVLQEIVDDVGIEIVSYVLDMNFYDLSRDFSILDQFQKVASFIQSMGGKYIIVEQGLPPANNADIDTQLNDFEKAVTDFSGICVDSGVELIFHPTPNSFISNNEIMDRMVELIYPLGARICLDVCDFLKMGVHPIQFMKKYFDAVKIVHLNDMKILKGKKSWMINPPEQTLLGQGRVDINSIWTYLQANEYKGWVIASCPEDATLEEGIDKTTHFINKELEVFLTNML
ncbi:MAG: sugar phosphate isomerase/epimerase [Planctomycetes bacterium]|nr:sugar phosphate isomerase/epimerase [Planctomycetota bacterium]